MGLNIRVFPSFDITVLNIPSLTDRDCFIMRLVASPVTDRFHMFFRRGDANGDGERDISDPIIILMNLFWNRQNSLCLDSNDSDDDGNIDISDAIYLINILFLDGEYPPIPSTFCGIDPTDDALGCEGGQRGCGDN